MMTAPVFVLMARVRDSGLAETLRHARRAGGPVCTTVAPDALARRGVAHRQPSWPPII
ncbi:hypothetical protein [Streptomyces sp. XY66]|uniref:hypothetical protein n=1 Tax=Streptomyces sp. XY66 TaxID=1415563 RepID=UPI00131C2FD6|nr:hypothetical protein [Streptomyces sp. XY66]